MKRLLLLVLLTVSCSPEIIPTDPEPIQEEFKCPEIIDLPQGLIGTLENPFQGDILIDHTKQAGVTTELWEKKIVPIHFEYKWTENEKKIIRGRLAGFRGQGFTFPEIGEDEAFVQYPIDHIFIKRNKVSVSYIGKKGGQQEMYLNFESLSSCDHEFGHALGLHHPHVTSMQDEWLTIYHDNIIEEKLPFFFTYEHYDDSRNQTEGFEYGDEYDIYSMMNYPSNAFAKDVTKPTMTLKDGTWFVGGEKMSEGDKISINRMYECYKNRKL